MKKILSSILVLVLFLSLFVPFVEAKTTGGYEETLNAYKAQLEVIKAKAQLLKEKEDVLQPKLKEMRDLIKTKREAGFDMTKIQPYMQELSPMLASLKRLQKKVIGLRRIAPKTIALAERLHKNNKDTQAIKILERAMKMNEWLIEDIDEAISKIPRIEELINTIIGILKG